MKRRTLLGLIAVPLTALAAGAAALGGAWAWAQGGPGMHGPGGPGMRSGMMKRMISAALDEALDQASVTPEQRTAIHASRDRVFAAMDAQQPDRGTHREQVLALFESDTIDPGQVQALHAQMEARHQAMRDAITQAIIEIHDTLRPEQRKVVANYVRTHGPRGMH
jgi:Spy/CpxP family protein refolding chaperone